MIGASAQFVTAEAAHDRSPTQKTEVAWGRTLAPGVGFFTLDVSNLDGLDILKGSGSAIANFYQYAYTDESARVISFEVDRQFDEPVASFGRAVLDIVFDNHDGHFDANGPLSPNINPGQPFRGSLGFNYGTAEYVQKFLGVNNASPKLNRKEKTATFEALDLGYTVWNAQLSQTAIITNQRFDQVIKTLLQNAGIATDQIIFDPSERTLAFAYFETGALLGNILPDLLEADMATFYFDEKGTARYRARDWYARNPSPSPFDITDEMAIDESDPDDTHIINHVQVKASPLIVQGLQFVWSLGEVVPIPAGGNITLFTSYQDPVTSVTQAVGNGPDSSSNFVANAAQDGTGIDLTSSVSISSWTDFANSSKVVFANAGSVTAYLTGFRVFATPAKAIDQAITVVLVDQTSIDAYGDYSYEVDNDYIQSSLQARNLAQTIINDYKTPGSYKELTLVGRPRIQLGDQVTRSGQLYNVIRVFDTLTADGGLQQTLKLVSRTVQTYFRLDISNLNGPDTLAP